MSHSSDTYCMWALFSTGFQLTVFWLFLNFCFKSTRFCQELHYNLIICRWRQSWDFCQFLKGNLCVFTNRSHATANLPPITDRVNPFYCYLICFSSKVVLKTLTDSKWSQNWSRPSKQPFQRQRDHKFIAPGQNMFDRSSHQLLPFREWL